MRLICCAPGCIWSREYPADQPPAHEPGAGYTPLARCPECGTPESTHYACEYGECWERATSNMGCGWRCRPHKREIS